LKNACSNKMYTLFFVFSFPLVNKQITKQWTDAIQIKGFVRTKYSRICSKHFLELDFKNINGQRLHLKMMLFHLFFVLKIKSSQKVQKKKKIQVL